MDVRFISTTSSKLPDLPIVAGQLIYLSDINMSYYDISSQRYPITSFRLVNQLPANGQPNVVYGIINASGKVDASIWDSSSGSYKSMTGYVATASSLGLVKPDGTTVTVDANGTITAHTIINTIPATSITYDNSVSGMASTNVQAAVTELNSAISSLESRVQALETVAANAIIK